ncbi:MAG: hypothetical protein M1814_002569 [Vezdaea aestivalis]|nr:MAG: hypothetical protein M1814_002569 [Vezdaea aestivalis]
MVPPILPSHRSGDGKIMQLSYDLPHRIYTVVAYPIKSLNGSSIVLYGHQRGLRILWLGGRPFKAKASAAIPSDQRVAAKTNGAATQPIVIDLDSEDDKPSDPKEYIDAPEFEGDEADSYVEPGVAVQDLDLDIGAGVIQIAVSPIYQDLASSAVPHERLLLAKKLVLGLCCDDGVVRVVTISSTPPSPQSKARPEVVQDILSSRAGCGVWGETLLKLPTAEGFTGKHTKVAITFSPIVQEPDVEDSLVKMRQGAPRIHFSTKTQPGEIVPDFDLLVASYSEQFSGVLFVYRVPLVRSKHAKEDVLDISLKATGIWQMQNLACSLNSLSFNPRPYSKDDKYSHAQILLSDRKGAVRIYATTTPTDDQGTWLLSLHTPFGTSPIFSSLPVRKGIVDAQWILSGTAILVLLYDGCWGIWNIESDITSNNKPNLSNNLQGGSLTPFSVTGRLEVLSLRPSQPNSQTPPSTRPPAFAPLTPRARRTEQGSLFGHTYDDNASGAPRPSLLGGIVIQPLIEPSTGASDESVALFYENMLYAVRNIRQYVASRCSNSPPNTANGSLFGFAPVSPDMLYRVDGLSLHGQTLNGASVVPSLSSHTGDKHIKPLHLVVAGEHQLSFIFPRGRPPGRELLRSNSDAMELDEDDDGGNSQEEQELLAAGALGVSGIDRALLGMEQQRSGLMAVAPTRRRVEFR